MSMSVYCTDIQVCYCDVPRESPVNKSVILRNAACQSFWIFSEVTLTY